MTNRKVLLILAATLLVLSFMGLILYQMYEQKQVATEQLRILKDKEEARAKQEEEKRKAEEERQRAEAERKAAEEAKSKAELAEKQKIAEQRKFEDEELKRFQEGKDRETRELLRQKEQEKARQEAERRERSKPMREQLEREIIQKEIIASNLKKSAESMYATNKENAERIPDRAEEIMKFAEFEKKRQFRIINDLQKEIDELKRKLSTMQ